MFHFKNTKEKGKSPVEREDRSLVFIMQIYRQFSQTLPMHKYFVRNYFSSNLMIFNRYMASFTANISTAEDNIYNSQFPMYYWRQNHYIEVAQGGVSNRAIHN